jgi:hypothetical protein
MTSFSRERTSEKARLGKVGRNGFDFGDKDEVAGNVGVELTFEMPTAGEVDATT